MVVPIASSNSNLWTECLKYPFQPKHHIFNNASKSKNIVKAICKFNRNGILKINVIF